MSTLYIKDANGNYIPVPTIRGAKGDPGVYVGTEEPNDPNVKVWVEPDATPEPVVKYERQTLSEAEKEQARENIGAAGIDEVGKLSEDIADLDSVRYDTAQTLTEEQQTLARGNIGAINMELIWENASPASSFGEQIVTLDLSRAKAIFVQVRNNVDGGGYLLSYGPFPKHETVIIERNVETYVYTRKLTPRDAGVTFLNCNQGATFLVPLKIWAVFE